MPDATPAGRAARSIRAHLLLLVLGVLLPALAFACIVVWRFAAAEQVRLENEAQDVARDVTAAIDRALAGLAANARVLAGSEALEAGDTAAFQRYYLATDKPAAGGRDEPGSSRGLLYRLLIGWWHKH